MAAWLALASGVSAQAPPNCNIGAFVTGLHDIDSAARAFKADFRLWSVCPRQDLEPLKTLDFPNASEVKTSLEQTAQRGNAWWSIRKVSGTFNETFEMDSFPFDRHPLVIEMEDGGVAAIRLDADRGHSGMDLRGGERGWRFKDAGLRAGEAAYPTSFGDPGQAGGQTRRSTLQLVVHAERAHLAAFVKMTVVLYISAFLVLVSLFFDVGDTDLFIGRVGLHASALFAVVLNWVTAGGTLGHHDTLSLLDDIHVATLVLILAAASWSVFAYRSVAAGVREERVRRWDGRSALLFLAVFAAVNVALCVNAIQKGGAEPPASVAAR